MAADTQVQRRKIEDTVIEILQRADMDTATEYSVRAAATELLGIDLSDAHHKLLVRRVVESFLLDLATSPTPERTVHHQHNKELVVQDQQQQKQQVTPDLAASDTKERIDESGRIICKLAEKRNVAVYDFRGNTLVSIRDYYQKDGKELPSGRGISLSTQQWSAFRQNIPAIEAAITKMEARIRAEEGVKHNEAIVSYVDSASAPAENKPVKLDVCGMVTASAPQGLVASDGRETEVPMTNFAPVSATAVFTSVEMKETNAVGPISLSCAPQGLLSSDSKQNGAGLSHSLTGCLQGLLPVETIRLDGKNYYCWVRQMEFFLEQLKIAYVLTEPCPNFKPSREASSEEIAEAKAATQKWIDDDYICRRYILNALCDHLYNQCSKKISSAKELWEELKIAYNEDFGTKRSQVHKYIYFQMVDGISILEQVQELHNIANSIITSGMWIDENFHVSVIISKLPPSWKEYRAKLMLQEFLPVNMLMHYLKMEEEARRGYNNGEPPKNGHVVDSKLDSGIGPSKKEGKKQCYICGKEGHISTNCHRRTLYIREKSNERDNGCAFENTEE